MSTSTSPRSELRTVLLWGDRWWLDGEPEPVVFIRMADAAGALAAHFGDPAPVRVRLVYQPDTFHSAPVNCPNGGRAILAAALAGEYPAVASPGHAWSYEPVLPDATGFSTWLHFEREPVLFDLVAALGERRIAVESAWPLATFLHALPQEWSETGAVTVVAIKETRACAYRHPRDGIRSVRTWDGGNAHAEVHRWLEQIFARDPSEPVLVIAPSVQTFEIACTARDGLRVRSLSDALSQPVVLARQHAAQLLPPAPVVTAQRVVIAASIALMAAAGWSGALHARDLIATRDSYEGGEARKVALRAEVAHLRANEAEMATLRAGLPNSSPAAPAAPWLRRLSETLPPEITLSSLRVSAEGVTVTGFLAPGSPAGLLDAWKARISTVSEGAVLHTTMTTGPSDRFTLAGGPAR